MPTKKQSTKEFENELSTIDQKDIVILDNIQNFPFGDNEFIIPHLSIAVNHRGTAQCYYDHHLATFTPNVVAILPANHIMQGINTSDNYSVTLIIASDRLATTASLSAMSYDHQKYHLNPAAQLTDEQMEKFNMAINLLKVVAAQDKLPNRIESLSSMLHVIFNMLTAFRGDDNPELYAPSRHTAAFNQFMDLLAIHYADRHEVTYYAEQLGMSPKYFSKMINDLTGEGANAWISEYIATQAKKLILTRPDMSMQEIGEMLGYKEQASFTRFFHNFVGMSPREFKKSSYEKGVIPVMQQIFPTLATSKRK